MEVSESGGQGGSVKWLTLVQDIQQTVADWEKEGGSAVGGGEPVASMAASAVAPCDDRDRDAEDCAKACDAQHKCALGPRPSSVCSDPAASPTPQPYVVGEKYMILEQRVGSSLHTCYNIRTQQSFVCKVVGKEANSLVRAHYRLDSHPHVNSLHEVVVGDKFLYLIFPPSHGDLHSHVRHRKRLREPEARRLFRQIAETVRVCHDRGIVLRDLKLRKFVFADQERTELKLETFEDAVVLEKSSDDVLRDKRGCPAYVSPEILRTHAKYSGRAADMWSLGVILYTMLVGRYPFSDSQHASLFFKISRGHFVIPEFLSCRARCLITSLLRLNPNERLTASDVLLHPWFSSGNDQSRTSSNFDQVVPDMS
nr:PREDICTED: tribbles homolog 2-like [Bemisia tabaci]